jgi:uncharacterized membrane protein YoaK (UPF0700 family)
VSVPSVDDSLGTKWLPFALSMVAGSVDIIGFLGLDGLFTAHITGNIVILAAKLVAGQQAPVSYLISVPVFMVVLALTRLFVVLQLGFVEEKTFDRIVEPAKMVRPYVAAVT